MNSFYNFYTHWTYLLSLIERTTKINVFPSIVSCFVISFFLALFYNLNIDSILFIAVIHAIPFLWTKVDLTPSTITKNILLSIIYFAFVCVRFQSLYGVYRVYDEQYKFLKNPSALKNIFLKGETNISLFC